ncbi:MAG TPA: hypothetical protein VN541_24675 [Tepidisphaeraceae bacterium]|nr:hypothetical protein [Tepidisphaeraceae bacterium]
MAKEGTDGSVTGFLYDYKKLLHETDAVGGSISNTYLTTTDEEFGDLLSEDEQQFTHQYDAMANTNALLDNTGTVQANYKYYAFGQVASVLPDMWSTLSVGQWSQLSLDQWASLPLGLGSQMLAGGEKQYYLDDETQLYLLGTGTNGRYYDPAVGRFISEDPIRHPQEPEHPVQHAETSTAKAEPPEHQGQGASEKHEEHKHQEGGVKPHHHVEDPNLYTYVVDNPLNKLDPSGHDSQTETEKKQEEEQRRQRMLAAQAEAAAKQQKDKAGFTRLPDEKEFQKRVAKIDRTGHPADFDPRAQVVGEITHQRMAEVEKKQGRPLTPEQKRSWLQAVDRHYGNRADPVKQDTSYEQYQAYVAAQNTPLQNFSGGFAQGFTAFGRSVEGVVAPKAAAEQAKAMQDLPVASGPASTVGRFAGGAAPLLPALIVAPEAAPALMAIQGGVSGVGNTRIEAAQLRASGHQVSGMAELKAAVGHGAVDAAAGYLGGKLLQVTGGLGKSLVARLGIQTATGAGLGAAQTAAENLVTQKTIDPTRKISEGVKESAISGGGTMFAFGSAAEFGRALGFGGVHESQTPDTAPTAKAPPAKQAANVSAEQATSSTSNAAHAMEKGAPAADTPVTSRSVATADPASGSGPSNTAGSEAHATTTADAPIQGDAKATAAKADVKTGQAKSAAGNTAKDSSATSAAAGSPEGVVAGKPAEQVGTAQTEGQAPRTPVTKVAPEEAQVATAAKTPPPEQQGSTPPAGQAETLGPQAPSEPSQAPSKAPASEPPPTGEQKARNAVEQAGGAGQPVQELGAPATDEAQRPAVKREPITSVRSEGGVPRRGIATKTESMAPVDAARWQRYLSRRNVTVKYGQETLLDKVDAEALYDPNTKTIYLRNNPSKSAFLEEAFHAIQDVRGLPEQMQFKGITVDKWEFEAQRSLIQNRLRLGIPNEQTRQTIQNLRDVYAGRY